MKAHSAESSPKRISSLSMSTYNNIAHKLPFPSQSLRRRSADPSDLLRYSGDGARAGGSSILSPVWEASPQYNMMTIREVMSLCGSTTSLASTQSVDGSQYSTMQSGLGADAVARESIKDMSDAMSVTDSDAGHLEGEGKAVRKRTKKERKRTNLGPRIKVLRRITNEDGDVAGSVEDGSKTGVKG